MTTFKRFPAGLHDPRGVDLKSEASRARESYERWVYSLHVTYGAAALPVSSRGAYIAGWTDALEWVARRNRGPEH